MSTQILSAQIDRAPGDVGDRGISIVDESEVCRSRIQRFEHEQAPTLSFEHRRLPDRSDGAMLGAAG
jgi:hypothetical protein